MPRAAEITEGLYLKIFSSAVGLGAAGKLCQCKACKLLTLMKRGDMQANAIYKSPTGFDEAEKDCL